MYDCDKDLKREADRIIDEEVARLRRERDALGRRIFWADVFMLAWCVFGLGVGLATLAVMALAPRPAAWGAPAPLPRRPAPAIPARCTVFWHGTPWRTEFGRDGSYRAYRRGDGALAYVGRWNFDPKERLLVIAERYVIASDFTPEHPEYVYVIRLDSRLREGGRADAVCPIRIEED